MKTMTARYAGKCIHTGRPIRPGNAIVFVGKGKAYLIDPDAATGDSEDLEANEHAGQYLRHAAARGVSDIWNSGGKEFYRNRRGRVRMRPAADAVTPDGP